MDLQNIYVSVKEPKLYGRYINNDHITPLLNRLKNTFEVSTEGYSVNNEPIYKIVAGKGSVKVFIWSQMHGNESTTTKAIFDFLNFLVSGSATAQAWLQHFTFYILPILNPDGARLYTRENANKVDLNRDSLQLTQPESQLLRAVFNQVKPDYCFNMHDQRTIFGVGEGKPLPATVSFLAPSYNETRDINECRQVAINVIAAMNDELQKYIPGKVGRFDDSFNINCIGDMFQSLGVPTVLFEAGHYPDDYEREETRKMIFFALFTRRGFKLCSMILLAIAIALLLSSGYSCLLALRFKLIAFSSDIRSFASGFLNLFSSSSIASRNWLSEIGIFDFMYLYRSKLK